MPIKLPQLRGWMTHLKALALQRAGNMLLVGRVSIECGAGRIGAYVVAQGSEGRGNYCGTGVTLCWKQKATHAACSITDSTTDLQQSANVGYCGMAVPTC